MSSPAWASPTPHTSARSEALPSALARVYARALQRYQEKHLAEGPAPEPNGHDAERNQNDGARTILH